MNNRELLRVLLPGERTTVVLFHLMTLISFSRCGNSISHSDSQHGFILTIFSAKKIGNCTMCRTPSHRDLHGSIQTPKGISTTYSHDSKNPTGQPTSIRPKNHNVDHISPGHRFMFAVWSYKCRNSRRTSAVCSWECNSAIPNFLTNISSFENYSTYELHEYRRP